ncbi:MAG: iron-containing alcohol dehydrogenase [Peptoniphilaceae bacterium]|nr:iron-containing alcohol dehydrogenase [Peptoniphilaceae bacterium]MDY6019026.1 iron-containing alcohol dehydrogenase [Anaerococcus sp.]
MNDFTYYIPTKIHFGKNALDYLGQDAKKYGKKVLLTYGGGSIKKNGIYDRVIEELTKADMEIFELSGIKPNPRIESVREGADICKKENIDLIIAIGGGSTIDATKFMAAGAKVDFDPWLFISEGREIKDALPIFSILTIAATGSEMDTGGVITNEETNEKLSTGSEYMRPKVSYLNPEYTYSVSKFQTASGSSDILSHLFEIYFNDNTSMHMLDQMMEALMKTVIKYAPRALENPEDYEARANLMWASSWAINGFLSETSQKSWSCHPMEHELSAFYDITHGLGLAILTPRWMEYILDEETVDKFVDYGVNVFGIDKNLDKFDIAKKAIEKTSEFFFDTLGLDDSLTKIGIDESKFDIMAKKACNNSSIKGFKELKPEDVKEIYKMCL